uniref:Guanylate cyclase domain-containing protein n=1 Tax=Neobodo designis TaxID=312471 RepID=A0A7S1LHJ1_NEODS|mmetsp:Transcript_22051/g.68431  ORF Transcript_22051/g.68431 Transcript_22051/m.68431 type:complete len:953 (+) Transcript_22051:116-2974(+)
MPSLSLRVVISVTSAVLVTVVAAVTLAVLLTTTTASLRDVGRSHALGMIDTVKFRTMALFEPSFVTLEHMANLTATRHWPWPSDDPGTQQVFFERGETLYQMRQLQSPGIIWYFWDNTRMSYDPFNSTVYRRVHVMPSPISAPGGRANQTFTANSTYVRPDENFKVYPRQYLTYVPPATASFVGSSFGSLLLTVTGGGRQATIAGIFDRSDAASGEVISYVLMMTPLYRLGDTRDPANLFGIGVESLDISSINAFLASSRATPNTQAFAADSFGYLYGSSILSRPIRTITSVPPGTRTTAQGCSTTEALGDVSDGSNYLVCRASHKTYGHAPLAALERDDFRRDGQHVALRQLSGDNYFVATVRVPMRLPGMPIQLVLLMPEADVIGDVVKSRNVAIGIVAALVVVAAVVNFAVIFVLLAPLEAIAGRMRKAANLEDDGEEEGVSAMAEVAALQEAYYEMNEELNRIRSFVPQSVLMAKKQAAENDDEAEDEEPDDDGTNVLSDHGGHSVASHRTGNSLSRPTSAGSHNPNTSSSAHPVSAHTAPLSPMPGSELSKTSGQLRASIDDDARSCASGARSTRSHRVAGARRGGAVLATATLLKQRVVTVLVANLCGFLPQLANTFSLASAVANVSDTVDFVYRTVSRHGGVVASYHGDHFVATFNAVKSCGSHALSAAKVGTLLTDGSDGVGFGAALRVGIATGKCHVGNLGNKEVKAFSTVGPAYQHASVLERMGRLYGEADERSVLATRRTCADIATMFRFRFVDVVALPGRDRGAGATITPIATLLGLPNRGSNFAHDENGDDDEWLYVVGDEDSSDPNARWNEAFSLLMADEVSAAQTMVQPYRDATLGSVSVSEKLTVDVAPSDPPGTVVPEIRVSVAPATPEEAPVSANQRNSAAEGVHSTGPKHPLRTRREAPNGQDIVRFDRLCDRQSSARHRDLGEFYDAAFSIR